MSRGSVRLLTCASGRRELGFEFSLRGADKISTPTSGHRVLKPHEFPLFCIVFCAVLFASGFGVFQNAVSRGRCRNLIGTSKRNFESKFSTSRTKSQKSNRTSGHPKVKILNGPLDTLKNSNRTSGHKIIQKCNATPGQRKI